MHSEGQVIIITMRYTCIFLEGKEVSPKSAIHFHEFSGVFERSSAGESNCKLAASGMAFL